MGDGHATGHYEIHDTLYSHSYIEYDLDNNVKSAKGEDYTAIVRAYCKNVCAAYEELYEALSLDFPDDTVWLDNLMDDMDAGREIDYGQTSDYIDCKEPFAILNGKKSKYADDGNAMYHLHRLYTISTSPGYEYFRMDLWQDIYGMYCWVNNTYGVHSWPEIELVGYEEVLNSKTIDILNEHLKILQELQKKGIYNATVTDSSGNFKFYGLNPKKNYVVKFTYNGMRYEALKTSYTIGNTAGNVQTDVSKATENATERATLIKRFSEIGTYPYNYQRPNGKYNKAFNQNDVETETKGNYGKYLLSLNSNNLTEIQAFILDTKISATINLKGNLLEEAEKIVKQNNGNIDKAMADTVYPTVYLETEDSEYSSYAEALNEYNKLHDAPNSSIVGYIIEEVVPYIQYTYDYQGYCKKMHNINHYGDVKYTYKITDTQEGEVVTQKRVLYKTDTEETIGYKILWQTPIWGRCKYTWKDKKGNLCQCAEATIMEQRIPDWSKVKYRLKVFYVKESYHTQEKSKILYAILNGKEPYLSSNSSFRGQYDLICCGNNKTWAFPDKIINTDYGWGKEPKRTKAIIVQELVESIVDQNKKLDLASANLGVIYRPTVDLGLYNDVTRADITINSKSETVKYDKRAANGGTFKFGVNEYDINGGSASAEEAYANYYTALSNGTITESSTDMGGSDYTYWMRNEDIENAFGSALSPTETGKAPAGGYSPYEVNVVLTYKIRLINQAETKAAVTEVVDYYSNDFYVSGVYTDANKTSRINYTSASIYNNRGAKGTASGYSTVYIPINKTLNNNESTYIYVELTMKDAKGSLRGKLDGEGYKAFNYAEINGYKTDIGVIDIDSMPGNIVDDGKGRFENGKYEDDESKSPALIFKNPAGEGRTIKGTVFEDETGMPEIVPGATRDGDGIFNGDKPVVGAIVQLVEYSGSSSPKTSATDGGTGVRAQTVTDASGNYEFNKIVAGDYKVQFVYGYNDQTVLTTINGGANAKSYNGQDYENTAKLQNNAGNPYWYAVNSATRYSDATDVQLRRNDVIAYSTTLTNHIAEVFNSYKDSAPNMTLVGELRDKTWMNALTEIMAIEVEDYRKYPDRTVETQPDGTYTFDYMIDNTDFGIVERERAEIQITKKVSYISLVDSSGKVITEGKYGDSIKYVKWIPGEDGFLDMEIDTELLSGATLKVTYEITVANTSESGNDISKIEVVDYVSNNLNFDQKANSEWKPITTTDLAKYVNSTSLNSSNPENKINLDEYQTILITEFATGGIGPKQSDTKYLTLEKNLSSDEESNFNYENQVEIVSSYNRNGRGDYSSIYGNLDPTTYTSRQGDLKWDHINIINENQAIHGYAQMRTATTEDLSAYTTPNDAIRLAEKDSGNAEEVIITPPTGATGIVLQPIHYILALIALTTLAATTVLIKKYIAIEQE